MKILTIGRDPQSNICINDPRVSRRHALLKIHATGKMEIVDVSANGTYVNGVKLTPNRPFPVKRNNRISFAQGGQLDWDDVPNPRKYVLWVLIALLLLVAGVIGVTLFNNYRANSDDFDMEGGGGGSAIESTQGRSGGAGSSDSADSGALGDGAAAKDADDEKDKSSWYDEAIKKDQQQKAKEKREKEKEKGKNDKGDKSDKDSKEGKEAKPDGENAKQGSSMIF